MSTCTKMARFLISSKVSLSTNFCICGKYSVVVAHERRKFWAGILGHGGGRQEGGRKWAGREGDSDFSCRRGVRTFCSRWGEGYCKIAKRALQNHFLREVWELVKNMYNFAVFWHNFFVIFTCSIGKNFSWQRGVKKNFSGQGGSIKCPAPRGGIRTLPFRRGVKVPFPPMPTYVGGPRFFRQDSHFCQTSGASPSRCDISGKTCACVRGATMYRKWVRYRHCLFPTKKEKRKTRFCFGHPFFYHDGVVVAPHVVDGEEDALAVLLLVGLLQVALIKRKNGIYN